jgi:maltooligosyltrehalose trehalohydrolase
LRFFGDDEDRLLIANFGKDERLSPCPEPLLAPPEGQAWEFFWNSDAPHYGGWDIGPVMTDNGWYLPAECTVLLRSRPTTGG